MPKRKSEKTLSFGIHITFDKLQLCLTEPKPNTRNSRGPRPHRKTHAIHRSRGTKGATRRNCFLAFRLCPSPCGFSFSKMAQMALSASPTLTLFNSKLSSPMGWSIFIPHLHEKTVEAARTLLLATFLVFSFCVCLVCKRNENPPELSQPEVFFYFEVIPMKSLIPRIGISFSLSIFSQIPNRTVLLKAIYIIIHALSWPIETFCGWMRKLWKQSKLLFLIVFFIMIFLLC